jgi:tetratricopeptide (TPR) repeat protein
MNANDKLRRYRGKDYSEIVEFPVELVDRDGVVRRYSYHESLRVYLRRISSARWRYNDDSLVDAEVDHCNKRIDQLRRSYLVRCRNLGANVAADQHTGVQFVLGEGLTLLEEQLGPEMPVGPMADRSETELEIVAVAEEENPAVYQIHRPAHGDTYLLYVFAKGESSDPLLRTYRESFDPRGAGVRYERLIASREGETADFLLTQRLTGDFQTGSDALGAFEIERAVLSHDTDEALDELPPGGEEFAAGLAALRRHGPAEAIQHFKDAVECNPYHREAYLALSTLLDSLGEVGEAEMYAALAMAYLPEDGLVHFNRGLNLMRQGRRAEALDAFGQASGLDPRLYQPRYFAGLVHTLEGRLKLARVEFEAALVHAGGERARVEVAVRWVRHRQRVRLWAVLGAASTAVAGIAVMAWSPWAAIPCGLASIGILVAWNVQSRLARRWFARYSLSPADKDEQPDR